MVKVRFKRAVNLDRYAKNVKMPPQINKKVFFLKIETILRLELLRKK